MEQRLKNVRQVFLDMDGTIYHGSRLYPTTIPFLNFLKSRGIGYKFLSNNSSFSTDEYVAKLGRLGITATPDEFYISTDYCIDYIKANHPAVKKLFIMGMESIFPAFEAAGFTVTDHAGGADFAVLFKDAAQFIPVDAVRQIAYINIHPVFPKYFWICLLPL